MGEVKDVSEFYIIPGKRMSGYGQILANYVFSQHPGRWQVRQITDADSARAFWRRVIDKITSGNYLEGLVQDEDWGYVLRQSFEIAGCAKGVGNIGTEMLVLADRVDSISSELKKM